MTSPLPECSFGDPPVKEVSFSIQFEPINGFHIGLLGLAWDTFKVRYPTVESADELAHEIEKFGVISRKKVGFQLFEQLPLPRVLFISDDKQYLVQIQKDRFVFNWRKLFDDSLCYPRYPLLKQKFLEEFECYKRFLNQQGFELPACDQVEFTYVNHIDRNDRQLHHVFRSAIGEIGFPPSTILESFAINLKHLIRHNEENLGRLYTAIEMGNRIADGKEIYILKFTSRAHPTTASYDGMVNAMDIMRDEINKSFVAITTPEMHGEWKQEEYKS